MTAARHTVCLTGVRALSIRLGVPVKLFGSVLLLLTALCPHAVVAEARPNIVILYADDMGYGDLGSYGHPYIRTPNLDRLAAEGQRWTDFYVPAPVCSPSRGALLTGQYPIRSGLYGEHMAVMFPGDSHGIPEPLLTLAEGLRQAGYATGMFGKWHLGDASPQYPTRHGFDYWYGVPYSNDMNAEGRIEIEEAWRLTAAGRGREVYANFMALVKKFEHPRSEDYDIPLIRSRVDGAAFADELLERPLHQPTFTRRLTAEAISFIEKNRKRHFLVYLPYSMPHLPIFASEKFTGASLAGPYGDTIEEIDWSVGEIRRALEKAGVAKNTLLMFSSDNGPWQQVSTHLAGSAGMLRGSKGTAWEGGVRVPGIFWWPGTVRPKVVSDIGSVMDVYATALSLAGVAIPDATDGHDLTGVLLRGDAGPRNELAIYRKGTLRAYRVGDHKIHFFDDANSQTPLDVPRLYNLRRDVSERQDIAARQPAVLEALLSAASRHRESTPRAEPIFDKRFADLKVN